MLRRSLEMTFEELSEEMYEDLCGFVRSVESSPTGEYIVKLEFDSSWDGGKRRFVTLSFTDVAETSCDTGFCGSVCCYEEHVLLLNHNCRHESVYFSTAPDDSEKIIGRVYSAHCKKFGNWRNLGDYWHANEENLDSGNGLLFRGPSLIGDVYCEALAGSLSFSRISGHTPSGGYIAYFIDNHFVLAKSVRLFEE